METTRPQSRKSLWVSGGWYLLAALPVGLGILTGVLSILAAMMLFADAPEWMLRLMAGIALCFPVRHGSLCRIPPPPERLALRTVLRTLPVGSADAGEPGLAAYCRQSGAAVVSLRRRCLGWDFRRQCTPSETAQIAGGFFCKM